MRISSVEIHGLFGLFSYAIPLRLEDQITIIHGPNGCGKTTVLRTLFDIFAKRFGEVSRTVFDEMHILFEDGQKLTITKTDKPRPAHLQPGRHVFHQGQLEFSLVASEQVKSWTWVGIDGVNFPVGMIESHLPFLTRIDQTTWHDQRTDDLLSLDDVLSRYGERLAFLPKRPGQEMPPWLVKILDAVEVHFIQTQRLLRLATMSPARDRSDRVRHRAMVIEYSEEAVAQIKAALTESAQKSQLLDRNFPVRVLNERGSVNVSSESIRAKYQEQQEKRKRLQDAGFINLEIEVPLPDRDLEEVERQLLWLYLEDTDKKLSSFDLLLQKIEVLTDMINSRFLNKRLSIERDKGFVFKSGTNELPLASLSSGEQHELVLSFELLFRVKRGSLILIDEPELSLHVAWQHRFLEDLHRISELAGLDFLVATHSPQIIHKRWDLAQSLVGSDE